LGRAHGRSHAAAADGDIQFWGSVDQRLSQRMPRAAVAAWPGAHAQLAGDDEATRPMANRVELRCDAMQCCCTCQLLKTEIAYAA
jgi:hypothetical protein